MKKLVRLAKQPCQDEWQANNEQAFSELFGSSGGRYPKRSRDAIALRAPDANVPFSAFIHPSNPDSGQYGGMSFVLFPIKDGPCLISMVVGTQGLSPDDHILGRPGHARKVQAICDWLNQESRGNGLSAWAKQDPVRTDQDVPDHIQKEFSRYSDVFDRYGNVLYGFFAPNGDTALTEKALKAFLDLYFEERGYTPLSAHETEANQIQQKWLSHITPQTSTTEVVETLQEQQYVILQGPPGTGKTRLAEKIKNEVYDNRGFSIQFHAGVTYEDFVGGLRPQQTERDMGFQFQPEKGHLLKAVEQAQKTDDDVLLVIDEINRADLSKVLGEAIYLFETDAEYKRSIQLTYDYGQAFSDGLTLPENLHLLGTMNTADRSISTIDVAIRRRFSFINFWPDMKIVEEQGSEVMVDAFRRLYNIFIDYAPRGTLKLMPGHSYFLEADSEQSVKELRVTVKPLLEDYLDQGLISGFSGPIQGYIQWIDSLTLDKTNDHEWN